MWVKWIIICKYSDSKQRASSLHFSRPILLSLFIISLHIVTVYFMCNDKRYITIYKNSDNKQNDSKQVTMAT